MFNGSYVALSQHLLRLLILLSFFSVTQQMLLVSMTKSIYNYTETKKAFDIVLSKTVE